jgi:hypothetical protein
MSEFVKLPWYVTFFIFATCWPAAVFSKPVMAAYTDSGVITIHSEPCALKSVTNLPARATWVSGQGTFEGCAGMVKELGIVLMYFNGSNSVEVLLSGSFSKVTGV